LAPKTVRHIGFLVQGCLNQAVDWDLIPKNPMVKVKKPKVPRRRPAIVSTSGSAGLFARISGQKIYPLVLVYYSTGMRRGELLALKWTDLDWSAGMLEISKSLEQTKRGLRIKGTKSGETRLIALSEAVLEALREHQRAQRQERELFGSDYRDLGLILRGRMVTITRRTKWGAYSDEVGHSFRSKWGAVPTGSGAVLG